MSSIWGPSPSLYSLLLCPSLSISLSKGMPDCPIGTTLRFRIDCRQGARLQLLCLRCREQGILSEIERGAIGLVCKVCLEHVRPPHYTRVKERVDMRRAPNAKLWVLRDL